MNIKKMNPKETIPKSTTDTQKQSLLTSGISYKSGLLTFLYKTSITNTVKFSSTISFTLIGRERNCRLGQSHHER